MFPYDRNISLHAVHPVLRLCSINHADLTIVFAAPEHIPFLLTLSPKLPTLKYIVSLEPTEDDQKRVLTAWSKTRNITFMDIEDCRSLAAMRQNAILPSRSRGIRSGKPSRRHPCDCGNPRDDLLHLRPSLRISIA